MSEYTHNNGDFENSLSTKENISLALEVVPGSEAKFKETSIAEPLAWITALPVIKHIPGAKQIYENPMLEEKATIQTDIFGSSLGFDVYENFNTYSTISTRLGFSEAFARYEQHPETSYMETVTFADVGKLSHNTGSLTGGFNFYSNPFEKHQISENYYGARMGHYFDLEDNNSLIATAAGGYNEDGIFAHAGLTGERQWGEWDISYSGNLTLASDDLRFDGAAGIYQKFEGEKLVTEAALGSQVTLSPEEQLGTLAGSVNVYSVNMYDTNSPWYERNISGNFNFAADTNGDVNFGVGVYANTPIGRAGIEGTFDTAENDTSVGFSLRTPL